MFGTSHVLFQLCSPKWSKVPEARPLRLQVMRMVNRQHQLTIKELADDPDFTRELALAYEHMATVYGACSAYSRAGEFVGKAMALHEARLAQVPADDEILGRRRAATSSRGTTRT